jgi:hypothetical protein
VRVLLLLLLLHGRQLHQDPPHVREGGVFNKRHKLKDNKVNLHLCDARDVTDKNAGENNLEEEHKCGRYQQMIKTNKIILGRARCVALILLFYQFLYKNLLVISKAYAASFKKLCKNFVSIS